MPLSCILLFSLASLVFFATWTPLLSVLWAEDRYPHYEHAYVPFLRSFLVFLRSADTQASLWVCMCLAQVNLCVCAPGWLLCSLVVKGCWHSLVHLYHHRHAYRHRYASLPMIGSSSPLQGSSPGGSQNGDPFDPFAAEQAAANALRAQANAARATFDDHTDSIAVADDARHFWVSEKDKVINAIQENQTTTAFQGDVVMAARAHEVKSEEVLTASYQDLCADVWHNQDPNRPEVANALIAELTANIMRVFEGN